MELTNKQVQELINKPIDKFGLKVRALSCVRAAGVETFGDLISKHPTDFFRVKGFGKKTFNEITSVIEGVNSKYGTDFDLEYDISFLIRPMKKILNLDPKSPYKANIRFHLMDDSPETSTVIVIAMNMEEAIELLYKEFGEETTDILSIEIAGDEVYIYNDE